LIGELGRDPSRRELSVKFEEIITLALRTYLELMISKGTITAEVFEWVYTSRGLGWILQSDFMDIYKDGADMIDPNRFNDRFRDILNDFNDFRDQILTQNEPFQWLESVIPSCLARFKRKYPVLNREIDKIEFLMKKIGYRQFIQDYINYLKTGSVTSYMNYLYFFKSIYNTNRILGGRP